MQHYVDLTAVIPGELGERGCKLVQSATPILPAMASNQHPRNAVVAKRRRWKFGFGPQQGIDSAVAGHEDCTRHPFGAEIGRREFGRGEQKPSPAVDRDTIALLRPGHGWVVAAQPSFDVGHWNPCRKADQRSGDCAGRIALDDEQVRGLAANDGQQNARDRFDMCVRIFEPAAVQPSERKLLHVEFGRVECFVLASEYEPRRRAPPRESVGDRGKLDRFGAGSDDQPYICGMQPSP